jgi:2-octaprenylphenol hydroxylase
MNNNKPQSFDIAIVGAGMVGLSLACALARLNLKIAIIDRSTIPLKESWQGFDPRVSAIVKSSEYFLKNIGAWQFIEQERHCAYSGMDVWEKDGTGNIQFDSAELAESELGFVIENRIMQWAMQSLLLNQNNVSWFCPENISSFKQEQGSTQEQKWKIDFESGQSIQSELLIGADGALSFVREQLNIELTTKDLEHKAIVCNVETELPHDNIARQIFLPSGPIAFLPLAENDKACSIVWSATPQTSDSLMSLSESDFNLKLNQCFENKLGKVVGSDKRFSFPLFQRHAQTYISSQAALIGDAAHTIHPLAGQGVNLGYMDAAVLAEEIQRAQKRKISIGSKEVLRRYERRRRGQVTLMMNSMRGFQQIYSIGNADLIGLRNLGVKLTNKISPIKNHILSRAMGLDGDLPKLARSR